MAGYSLTTCSLSRVIHSEAWSPFIISHPQDHDGFLPYAFGGTKECPPKSTEGLPGP